MIGRFVTWALLLLLPPGSAAASFVDYKKREINVKVVYHGPDLSACQYNLASLQAHAKQRTPPRVVKMRSGVFVRTFTLVPRDARGRPYAYRRFKVRLWIHALSGRAEDDDVALLLKGADAVVFVQPTTASAGAVQRARDSLRSRLRRHHRGNAPVVYQHYGAPADKKPTGPVVRPGPLKRRDPGVFKTVRLLTRAIISELTGKKKP